jgi:hypothetical protein
MADPRWHPPLCLDGKKPNCEWEPISEAPQERRIGLAQHYPNLKAMLREARQEFAPQTAAAIASLR